ncbi:MAG TPA: hypothetical protein VNV82_03960 [Bryobacteraceae bacterium]|jgi:hypothetical protein|nr:hypothetical protein [Bryobacteraceae bacterium]
MNTFFQVTTGPRSKFNSVMGPNTVPPFIPATDFETGLFCIFSAGNLGSDIAFWVDDDIAVGGSNAAGGQGDGYLKFVNIGRYLHLSTDAMAIRSGQFELDIPFTPGQEHESQPL